MSLKTIESLRFYDYSIDRLRWTVHWQDQPIALNRKTFDLLLYLIDHRERVVTKTELLQALWPEQYIEESNLTQHVFLLRKAFSRYEATKKIIETVPGRGYRFTAPLIEPEEPDSQVVVSASESITRITFEEEHEEQVDETAASSDPAHRNSSGKSRRVLPFAASAVALGALAISGWFGWQRWLDHPGGPPIQVVITGTDGTTGDPTLDHALQSAFRMNLSQSPFVSLVPKDTVNATLAEMKQKPGDPITTVIARDLCERTNSQATLQGTVVRSGSHFLLTEEATSCVDGRTLAAARQEAEKPENLPGSIDKLSESTRRQLGESRSSVARFSAYLSPATTASLEALKAYSEASRMAEQGRLPDAINLLKKSVAEDPGFAIAWNDLWAYNASINGDPISGREAIEKAYSLRDSAGALERLTIIAHYNLVVVGDLFESERNYQAWTQLYPRSVVAWNGLSLTQEELGHWPDAEVSAGHAFALRPRHAGLNLNLALAQLSNGKGEAARVTCDHAVAQGIDSDHLRAGCLSVAYFVHDRVMLKAEQDWGSAHPKASLIQIAEADIAISEGRFADAITLASQAIQTMKDQGLDTQADSYARSIGIDIIEAGDVDGGTRMFRASTPDPETGTDLVGLAEIGDIAGAGAGLQAMEKEHTQATLWKLYWRPRVGAQIALANGKPNESIALLEPCHQLDFKGIEIPMLRGKAYLAAGQPGLAEKEFRFVLAHQELGPTSSFYPLAWLELGRALALEGKRPEALDTYHRFLALWARADPNAAFLVQAKTELAKFQEPH